MADEKPLQIYFAGAIRGGREDAQLYAGLIDFVGRFGKVLTTHVGDETLLLEEKTLTELEIFERDMNWLHAADCFIAEVSTPSLGVGYEIALAQALGKKILCLFRPESGRSLSAMIAGNPYLHVENYSHSHEAEQIITLWMEHIQSTVTQGHGQN